MLKLWTAKLILQSLLSLYNILAQGCLLAQGCYWLRAVFCSGLFFAQGCFRPTRQIGGEVHYMEDTALLLGA